MDIKFLLRNFFSIPQKTEDGILYLVTDKEVQIVGSKRNSTFTQIPSHIGELPVTYIKNLANSSLKGSVRIPGTVKKNRRPGSGFSKKCYTFYSSRYGHRDR